MFNFMLFIVFSIWILAVTAGVMIVLSSKRERNEQVLRLINAAERFGIAKSDVDCDIAYIKGFHDSKVMELEVNDIIANYRDAYRTSKGYNLS